MKFYTKLQDWLAGPFSQKMPEVYAEPVYACASGVFYDNSAYDYGWFIGKFG